MCGPELETGQHAATRQAGRQAGRQRQKKGIWVRRSSRWVQRACGASKTSPESIDRGGRQQAGWDRRCKPAGPVEGPVPGDWSTAGRASWEGSRAPPVPFEAPPKQGQKGVAGGSTAPQCTYRQRPRADHFLALRHGGSRNRWARAGPPSSERRARRWCRLTFSYFWEDALPPPP